MKDSTHFREHSLGPDGESANITWIGFVGNKLRISFDSPWDSLTPNKARKFAKWLNEAADHIEKEEVDRKKNSLSSRKVRKQA